MNNWIFIALGAGLTSAVLHATVAGGSPLALVLFYLAPLPLFIAGLGWGAVAAIAAGLVGALAVAVGVGFKAGTFFLLSTAAAPVLLSYLSLINRPADDSSAAEGEVSDDDVEWYPEGRLILWCAAVAGVLLTATVFIIGGSADGFREVVSRALEQVTQQMGGRVPAEQMQQVKAGVDFFARLAAPVAATVWLLATLFNMWMASWVLEASGRSRRPWAPFASYALPKTSTIALSAAALAAFLPSTLGLIGQVALFLLVTVFCVIGLAALHGLTVGNPMRMFILSSAYFALVVLGAIAIIPLVVLGLVDLMFGLRQRKSTAGGST